MLTLELQVVKLKQHVLRVINTTFIGSACGKFLDLLQNAYGYPESLESCQESIRLATFAACSSQPEEPEVCEERLTSSEEAKQAKEIASSLQMGVAIPRTSREPFKRPHLQMNPVPNEFQKLLVKVSSSVVMGPGCSQFLRQPPSNH